MPNVLLILSYSLLMSMKRNDKYNIWLLEVNTSQELKLKIIDERRSYLDEKTQQNDSMSKKHKNRLHGYKFYWCLYLYLLSLDVFQSLLLLL